MWWFGDLWKLQAISQVSTDALWAFNENHGYYECFFEGKNVLLGKFVCLKCRTGQPLEGKNTHLAA